MNDSSATITGEAPSAPPMLGASALLERALFEVKHVVVGQDAMVERMMIGLLAGGHVLIEGVPGVAKTLAVRTLAAVVGGHFTRLQFTPDLMPSDIVGTRVWRQSSEKFETEHGPIFANLVLADEINRAPAKVQSALLEAMAEHQVSIGGLTYKLPDPFLVLATQNPIENDGVYQLPEAQRDRFLLKVDVGHANELEELTIVQRMSGPLPVAQQILSIAQVVQLQREVRDIFVHHAVANYAVQLVMATREPRKYGITTVDDILEYGVSARGSLGLIAASRALALLRGRDYVLPADITAIAHDVLAHRLVLSFDGVADGVNPRSIIDLVLAAVPQPRISPAENAAQGSAAA